MRLKGTRTATSMWRLRDKFDACVYGDLYNCKVECKYFVKGDNSWRDDGNKNTVILYSPDTHPDFSMRGLVRKFEQYQEQAFLSGEVGFSRLTDKLQDVYKPVREEASAKIISLKEHIDACQGELEKLKHIIA